MSTLTDDSLMPYGKYKGKKMANVPPDYLIWLYDNGKCNEQVKRYVFSNYSVLQEEIRRRKAQNKAL